MYHYKGSLTVGQVNRFLIVVNHDELPESIGTTSLAIRVKNTTSALMRPAFMTGPYILYASVKEQSYRHDTALGEGDFPPHFDANVKTNCSRWQTMPIAPSSDSELSSRKFVVEVASQIIFSPSATVYYELTIGKDKTDVRHLARQGQVKESSTPGLSISMQDTSTIWDMPPIQRDHPGHHILPAVKLATNITTKFDSDGKPYNHLVVLTHGIHSNLTSDMLYLKDMIEKTAYKNGERVVCKGFAGNACNTERGVKWLAQNVGEWLLSETGWTCKNEKAVRGPNPYKRISFIAHSLGGLVQIYVLGYIHDKTHGRFFDPADGGLQPKHYITLATPWLGISAENPAYVKLALDFGLVGKTGQDLGLTTKPLGEYHVHDPKNSGNPRHTIGHTARVRSRAPLLSLLSRTTAPSHIAMRLFETRTIYANIENDGIVPLRTSSLFFLDWEMFSAQKARVMKSLESRYANSEDNNRGTTDDYDLQSDISQMNIDDKNPKRKSFNASDRPDASSDHSSSEHRSGSHDRGVSTATEAEEAPSKLSSEAMLSSTAGGVEDEVIPDHGIDVQGSMNNDLAKHTKATPHTHSKSLSKILSVAHAVTFAGMIRRVSGGRVTSRSNVRHEEDTGLANMSDESEDEDTIPTTPNSPIANLSAKTKALISGPSDTIEEASHSNGGLFGLMKPSQSHRKPSKAFTRSQTISKHDEDDHKESAKVHPEEPSKTSFFRALESVLNPPMPELDYITDPANREPPETVIVHDKFYYPEDIPPLKELPQRTAEKHQTHSEKKAEEKENVRLEKVRLEEKIAREWHKDMVWRKVLVKLKPDAHNNIIVRRTYPNCYGWPVIDHLVEHHFGSSAKKNAEMHESTTNLTDEHKQEWDREYLQSDTSSEEEGELETSS